MYFYYFYDPWATTAVVNAKKVWNIPSHESIGCQLLLQKCAAAVSLVFITMTMRNLKYSIRTSRLKIDASIWAHKRFELDLLSSHQQPQFRLFSNHTERHF